MAIALSRGCENVKYAEYDGPPLVALYTLLVFTTTLVRSPYCPKYSGALSISSWAISGAIPITYTRVFWMTRKFSSFFIFSFDRVLIWILLVPLGGTNPKLFRFFTQLLNTFIKLVYVVYTNDKGN